MRVALFSMTLSWLCFVWPSHAEPPAFVEAEALTNVKGVEPETQYAQGASGGRYLYLTQGTKTPGEGLASFARWKVKVERTGR